MKEFDELIAIADKLLGPGGCPWDQEQTFETIRTTLFEEAHEVIEAIEEKDSQKIMEELGDLLFNVLFLCKLGEKEKSFTTEDVIKEITNKLIRRHPHVFGDAMVENTDHLIKQWEEIKEKEKNNKHRKSKLDGIPKHLPALASAFQMVRKMRRANYSLPSPNAESLDNETVLGQILLRHVKEAFEKGLDPELALKQAVKVESAKFREWEKENL